MTLAALWLAFGALDLTAQPAPTRLGAISAVIQQRLSFFEQPLILDGCSLSRLDDLATTERGVLAPDVAAMVRGTEGACLRADTISGKAPNLVVFAMRLSRGDDGKVLPPADPEDERSLLTVILHVKERSTSRFFSEEWVVKHLHGGPYVVQGVRIAPGSSG